MTDLCYNCGNCHLPDRCGHTLVQCNICYCFGHMWVFCPRGVIIKDPTYRYWAICHNCDEWHLPRPCLKPLHDCSRCSQWGHLEMYCPVNPLERIEALREERRKLINPQQTPDNRVAAAAVGDGVISHQTITRIKCDAIKNALGLLDQGWTARDILLHTAGPQAAQDPTLLAPMYAPVPSIAQAAHRVLEANNKESQDQPNNKSNDEHGNQNQAQPQPAQPFVKPEYETIQPPRQLGGPSPSHYGIMHARFYHGDLARAAQTQLARAVEAEHARPHVVKSTEVEDNGSPDNHAAAAASNEPRKILPATPATETKKPDIPNATEDTDEVPVPETKKAAPKNARRARETTPAPAPRQGPRCAGCVKAHVSDLFLYLNYISRFYANSHHRRDAPTASSLAPRLPTRCLIRWEAIFQRATPRRLRLCQSAHSPRRS